MRPGIIRVDGKEDRTWGRQGQEADVLDWQFDAADLLGWQLDADVLNWDLAADGFTRIGDLSIDPDESLVNPDFTIVKWRDALADALNWDLAASELTRNRDTVNLGDDELVNQELTRVKWRDALADLLSEPDVCMMCGRPLPGRRKEEGTNFSKL